MRKTRDYARPFRGLWSEGGVCRVRLYEDEASEEPPVVVLSELPENHNTSLTNLIEVLACEVAAELGVLGACTRFIEHYPRMTAQLRAGVEETFDLVSFPKSEALDGFIETAERSVGGVRRPSFGEPEWTHLTRAQVLEMLGEDIGGEILLEEPPPAVESHPGPRTPPGPERAREHGMDLSAAWEPPSGDIILRRVPHFKAGLLTDDTLATMIQTNARWSVVHHSPSGFEYGYSGSGPADLALNILNMFVPPGEDGAEPVECFVGVASRTAWELHQSFKEKFIAPLFYEGEHTIAGAEIQAWIEERMN